MIRRKKARKTTNLPPKLNNDVWPTHSALVSRGMGASRCARRVGGTPTGWGGHKERFANPIQ